MDFKALSDFQRLDSFPLKVSDIKQLVQQWVFFQSPKSNSIISFQHSSLIDKILGFRLKYVEEMLVAEAMGFEPEGSHETWGPSLHDGVQTWVGLDLETMQTPYSECLRILQILKIKPYHHIIDLGAAYGRMGVVIGGLYIKNSFTGYEFVKARVDEGNRIYKNLEFSKCKLIQQDLFHQDFKLPEADVYFIYDYGDIKHIEHTLNQLEEVAYKRPIKLVIRGKYTKLIISDKHQWLDLKYQGRAGESFSIYSAYIA